MSKSPSIVSELEEAATIDNQKIITLNFVQRLFTENRKRVRTLYKAISYRILGSLATVIISFIFTHELSISLSIGAFELIGKVVLFYAHEVVWEKISWMD
jgi:uncharacterized membrane protein